jgi:ABC-2 type transport system permease protein
VIARAPIAAVTLRGLLDRKRFWLMVALAAVPVLLMAMAVSFSDQPIQPEDFDTAIVSLVLPLIALVFGTSAIGSELDEGTIVYLLTKPVRRLRIVLAKVLVAAALTAALVVPATLITGLVATIGGSDVLAAGAAYALAAALGGTAYVVIFLAVSTFTRWALAVGLVYVLLWEGILADLLPGTGQFSVRQATLGVARELADEPIPSGAIGLEQGLISLAIFIVGGIAIATWRMSRYQVRGGD